MSETDPEPNTDFGLCSSCQITPWGKDQWSHFALPHVILNVDYNTSLELLKESSRQGCWWCGIVHSDIVYGDWTNGGNEWYPGSRWGGLREPTHWNVTMHISKPRLTDEETVNHLLLRISGKPASMPKFERTMAIYARNEISAGPFAHPYRGPGSINPYPYIMRVTPSMPTKSHFNFRMLEFPSSTDLSIASQWLKNCQDNHPNCRGEENRTLPKRVLDVGIGKDSTTLLLYSTQPGERGDFIFLSYRWGGHQEIALKERSLRDFENGIVLGSLPATIREAVQSARDLNIRYLWIDVLCIMQDSPADIEREIIQMEQYLRMATLVLMPSGVTSVHDSFRHEDSSWDQHLYQEDTSGHDKPPIRFQKVAVHTSWGASYDLLLDTDDDANTYKPSKESLSTRGWVLQEQLLCSRVLIIPSTGGLAWQCDTAEYFSGRGVFEGGMDLRYRFFHHQQLAAGSSDSDYNGLSRGATRWTEIVDDYCKRDLTNPNDKLLAISGLAAAFDREYGGGLGEYCSGLWSNFLIESLGWSVTFFPNPGPAETRAPSWSWAAVDGARVDSNSSIGRYVQFVSCETFLVSPKFKFGQVGGGRLKIEASVTMLWWAYDPEKYKCPVVGTRRLTITQTSKTMTLDMLGEAFPDTVDNVPPAGGAEILFLLLDRSSKDMKGLILKPLGGNICQRCGCATLAGREAIPLETMQRTIVEII
ncbi:hypothetical protein BDZ45DRAFT_743672 [Acephala macrosclerotiorum]|nr:hypothetical protein BDZ45DRAFT_743672 [Acephala macrosclerotiorum]